MSEIKQPKSKRGGARPGAGRPRGSANVRTREIADKAAQEGRTPLEVMLEVMRSAFDGGDHPRALAAASYAAPYIHPRLQAIEHTGRDGGPMELGVTLTVNGVQPQR